MDGYPNVKTYNGNRLIIEDNTAPRFIAPTYFPAILGYAHEVHNYTLTEFGAWCSLFDLRRGNKPELLEEELAGIEFQPKIINKAKEYLNNKGIKSIVAIPEDLCKARGMPYRETDNHCCEWSDDRKWFGGRWDAIAFSDQIIIIEAKTASLYERQKLFDFDDFFIPQYSMHQAECYSWLMDASAYCVVYGFLPHVTVKDAKATVLNDLNTCFYYAEFDQNGSFCTHTVPQLLDWINRYICTKISPPIKTEEDSELFNRIIRTSNSQRSISL